MNIYKMSLLIAAAALLSACVNPVHTEADRHADVAGYKTFSWQAPERSEVRDPVLDSDLLDKRMRIAVIRYLEDQGYVYDETNPDFLVTYHTASKENVRAAQSGGQISTTQYHYHRNGSLIVTPLTPGSSHAFRSTTFSSDMASPRSYNEATLILDIIDKQSETLVWRGWEKKRLSKQRFDTKAVRKAVEEILSEFPVAS